MRELTEQEKVRREKLTEIAKVCNPYPDSFKRTHTLKEAKMLDDGTTDVSVCGRIIFMRKMGKLSFVRIRELEGDLQLELKVDEIGEEKYDFFKKLIDSGDFIGATGEIFTTQTGEKTLRVKDYQFLGKALRPLPEKFHGLQDTELKYRNRYVDLIMNQESRNVFLGRSKFYAFLHRYLGENGFLEVETPIMQTAVSGAAAKPFFTHHNALNLDMNLRIAPETYLKQCIAAGFDRVYEVAKCFRNEGMDTEHLQEFTQVEWYVAYWNFEDTIVFFQDFIKNALLELIGTTTINYRGNELSFDGNWERINYIAAMKELLGDDFLEIEEPEKLKELVINKGLFTMEDLNEYKSISQIIDFVYKKKIRANIVGPTILYNYPAVLKPLARRNDEDKNAVDVFQVVVCGTEICNAYSELVDPEIQRANFEEQAKAKSQGDDETMELDEDFMGAMEQGMPPISGLGFGIDRLMMLIYNQESIRDVVLFPTMKKGNTNNKESVIKTNSIKEELKTDFSHVVIEPLFKDYVDFENFSACDFRAVKVKDCVAVPKSKKLLQFTLDDGTGVDRTILSGIHAYYEPEELIGSTLIAILNLPPRAMMGISSCGMLLSCVHEENGEEKLNLIQIDNNIPAGAKLY
uniref:lysine--tRNA ligase n=1 Tax=Candidatus Ventrenecus sp. TaxID=3085654 RepID=UPI00402757D2